MVSYFSLGANIGIFGKLPLKYINLRKYKYFNPSFEFSCIFYRLIYSTTIRNYVGIFDTNQKQNLYRLFCVQLSFIHNIRWDRINGWDVPGSLRSQAINQLDMRRLYMNVYP